ncbi:hypothetical protein D3C86_1737870 [compost metagenome]
MSVKRTTGATGPKGSSVISMELSGRSVTTVGAKKKPLRSRGPPPTTTLPPCFLASSMKALMAGTRRSCARGPMSVPASRPSPTLMFFSTSEKRARNCS